MRLIRRINQLSEIGSTPFGISRPTGSPEDQTARGLIKSWMKAAGLTIVEDEFDNVIGRLDGEGPPIIVGSHIDTVATAGKYDGVLGVLAGIQVAEELNGRLKSPLEVVVFADEETSMDGSKCFTGQKPDIKAFLELHVEQGPVLDRNGCDIGVVEGIVGQRRSRLTVMGQENHAGTTPMELRDDALVKASKIVQYVHEKAMEAGGLVATVGQLEVLPGAFSVVPGRVDMTLQVRDLDADKMEAFVKDVCDTFDVARCILHESEPALCSEDIQEMIEDACLRRGLKSHRMPSRASHDAQNFTFCPMGMIFVPSVGGISHSPKEYTTDEQCYAGFEILRETILKIDARHSTPTRTSLS